MTPVDDPVAWAAAQGMEDPVRQRVLDALARRAATQPPGTLRERLVARLVQRVEAPPAALPTRSPANAPSPLTALVTDMQTGPELRNVQVHHRTWTALRLSRRMAEVSAPVPDHLGPLNSQVLVSRALQQLQALSPSYLQRLLTQLDTLAALATLETTGASGSRPGSRPSRRR